MENKTNVVMVKFNMVSSSGNLKSPSLGRLKKLSLSNTEVKGVSVVEGRDNVVLSYELLFDKMDFTQQTVELLKNLDNELSGKTNVQIGFTTMKNVKDISLGDFHE